VSIELLPGWIRQNYHVEERYHACSILHSDFRAEWDDLLAALQEFRLTRTMIVTKGGRKSPIALWFDGFFYRRGWEEKRFDVQVQVDGDTTLSPTHHVDYFRNRVAMETEWNNKDPFYDRDLTTFRLLFDLNVLSVGIIITRADELQEIFNQLGRGPSYGQSTTHMSRLLGKMNNRASGGCPVLAFGIRASLYDEAT
jgi:Restriction endonuclease BglII